MSNRWMVAAMAVSAGLTFAAYALGVPRGPGATPVARSMPAGNSAPSMSRREYLARIVAETAARSAAEAAHRRVQAASAAAAPATRVASADR